MKESITKFDLEAAFKALDAIEIPTAKKGIKANKPALTEIFSHKSKFDALMEEYYDIGNTKELSDAKAAREAEIAKAKLARIEKIVDLDAESPEDLLTSYVGKFIIQCPQCMTLFYKNPEDIEESEDDSTVVNVSEVCQHCGNESGYTLVGKVGEVTPEEAETNTAGEDDTSEEELTLDIEDESKENAEGDSDEIEIEETEDTEDFDLSSELDILEIEDDDESEEDNTNEALVANNEATQSLTEQLLNEESDLETSADDFEKLINTPEFKKPISDTEVRAMMQEMDESVNATKEAKNEKLEEGIFDKIKDKFIDFADKLRTRESKADWILQNAKIDYNKVKVDEKGKLIHDENNQRFEVFLVIGYTSKYTNGKTITMAPSFNDTKDLVVGENSVVIRKSYKDADNIAKGWSMQQDNGPAFIFMAKDKDDSKPVFLCQYFEGELVKDQDQLDEYFESIKKSFKGINLRAASGDIAKYSKMPAGEVKPGMMVVIDNSKNPAETAEIISTKKSNFGNGIIDLKVKLADNKSKTFSVSAETTLTLLKDANKTESIEVSQIVNDLEELQEASLEQLISSSLTEEFGNIDSFKITDCELIDENFIITGDIYFKSGNSEKTVYTFNEAFMSDDNKITLRGINEKLDLTKKFSLSGYIESTNKEFITESFK